MRPEILFVVLWLWALFDKSTSWELLEFQWVKNNNDELICATSLTPTLTHQQRPSSSSSSSLYSPKEHSVTNSELDSRAGQHGSKKATLKER